ncbi:HET-domain-containing protein [Hypoxylon sp. FL0543]|nr:HET-domain-containing protein [Hypoxylon sp. FL0543]
MSQVRPTITGKLCELCYQFISHVFAFNFTRQDMYPTRWRPIDPVWDEDENEELIWPVEIAWGDAFRHHETFEDLTQGAKTCELCNVLHADLASMDPSLRRGWLGLYPFWSIGRVAWNRAKGLFRAGFRESLSDMPWGSNNWGYPLHTFRVPWLNAYRRLPAMVASWQQKCLDAHPNCAKGKTHGELPTRVIDIGEIETSHIRLYESKGKKAPYTALTHCWGGPIPSSTTEANVTERFRLVNIDDLPQNFRDAIEVTRILGIRYLWVDALCIIQDSKADWLCEAGKMSSVFAGATVVISALDATTSTTGFMKADRIPLAIINDEYAVQKMLPKINDYFLTCPLVRRGWCMQERLLAPRLLHFGKEQMFWECQTQLISEDGRRYSDELRTHVMAEFMKIRIRMGISVAEGSELEWRTWYQLLEEYTRRDFSVSTDKLPALAGAAALFKSTKPAATYVAGLWKEDLARGLLWAAHHVQIPGRTHWNLSPTSEIVELRKPPQRRAPSWSWAALDGQLDFYELTSESIVVEVLDVAMRVGENELTEACPDGAIKLRGLVARMFYHPSANDIGSLTFQQHRTLEHKSHGMSGCIMDLDRRSPRYCWVMVIAQSIDDWLLLVLDKDDDGSYRRIGRGSVHDIELDAERFKTQIIEIV